MKKNGNKTLRGIFGKEIKKNLTVFFLLLIVLALAGCGKEEKLTMHDVEEANQVSHLLETYDNFLLRAVIKGEENYRYVDSHGLVYSDNECFEYENENVGYYTEEDVFTAYLYAQEPVPWAYTDFANYIDVVTPEWDRKDGKVYFTLTLPAEEMWDDDYDDYYGFSIEEGDIVRYDATLDGETLRLQEVEMNIVRTDGSQVPKVFWMTLETNVEAPDWIEGLRERMTYECNYQVDVVLDAGTEGEVRYSHRVYPGDAIMISLPETYGDLYSDEDGTQPVEELEDGYYSFVPTGDITLYSRAGDHEG